MVKIIDLAFPCIHIQCLNVYFFKEWNRFSIFTDLKYYYKEEKKIMTLNYNTIAILLNFF